MSQEHTWYIAVNGYGTRPPNKLPEDLAGEEFRVMEVTRPMAADFNTWHDMSEEDEYDLLGDASAAEAGQIAAELGLTVKPLYDGSNDWEEIVAREMIGDSAAFLWLDDHSDWVHIQKEYED